MTNETAPEVPPPDASPESTAWINHVVPFVAWMFIMQILGDPAGWKYALRSVLCLGIFIYLKPWQWYPRLNPKNILPALGVGVFVFAFWIAPELDWVTRHAWFHSFYMTVCIQPPWTMAPPAESWEYAPEVAGWAFTLARIGGSAFVISFIEEFFWRGWMYRWALKEKFLEVDLGLFDLSRFVIVALLFASVHDRWVVAFLCGLVYGYFVIRTRDVWAAGIAHALTNLLLGCWVVWAERYEFWS